MKNAVKWIVIAVLLVGIISGAMFLYNKFSDKYGGNNLVQFEQQTTENTESTTEDSEHQQNNDNAAPDFTVIDYEGNEVRLSDFKGKPVVLNFWATWCYYCKAEMPSFNEAYKKYPDVQFLMVNATDGHHETVETAKEYIEQGQFEFDVFFDTKIDAVKAYSVVNFPTTIFIDKDGNIAAQGAGMLTLENLEQGIEKITE